VGGVEGYKNKLKIVKGDVKKNRDIETKYSGIVER
jgi:hypothetical protein